MEQLELKHLTPYLPYGLKMLIKFPAMEESGELKALGLHPGTGKEERITLYLNTSSERGRQVILSKNPTKNIVKPLLLPLSEIKQFMPKILKNLSKLDLSDCTFDENEYEVDIAQWWCNAFDGDRVIACLTFDGNAFYIQYWHDTADDTFDIYEPQYEALQELAKYHLDYQYLIEAGLALNKLDYPNN